MPISLKDGQVYVIKNAVNVNRQWMLNFFLGGHTEDYLLLYNENNQYRGIISYGSLMQSTSEENAIIHEKLFVGENLWENAHELLKSDTGREIPVLNQNMEILYFAKYDSELVGIWQKLCELQDRVDKTLWKSLHHFEKHIHINGMNDVLFELREWLISLETEVSVEGEMWGIFGIEEKMCTDENIVCIDEKCKWLDSLYEEYRDWLEEYSVKLKNRLCKSYIQAETETEKIMFYLPPYPYFVDSISSLIYRYIQSDKECFLVFPSIKAIMDEGLNNIDRMLNLLIRLEAAGAKCYLTDEQQLYCNEYAICFLCSEYSGRLPIALRKITRYVVAIQTTALYTHMYQIKERFQEVFSEQARKEVDYLIASEYIADWICDRDEKWHEKILRFGYPKLDTLYYSLRNKLEIPNEWQAKIAGKKVFLFTTYYMEQLWLDFFADKDDNKIAIWRPHPLSMDMVKEREKIYEISEKYNIIIDDMLSYTISFQISDALIAALHSSVTVNYLYTAKPICIYGGIKTYQQATIDYREELWYKCACATLDAKDVLKFIDEVGHENNVADAERLLYRRRITQNFDGKVCDRIYDYFEGDVY